MKHKRTVLALSLLATIGIIAFFVLRVNRPTFRFPASIAGDFVAGGGRGTSHQKQSEDPWQAWVEKQTDETTKNMVAANKKHKQIKYPPEASEIAKWRTKIHAYMTKHADMMKEKYPSPAAMEANGDGLSTEVTVTVEDVPSERYTGPQTVEALMEAFDVYDRSGYTDALAASADEKYPRAEWLALLLEKGAVFGYYGDYSLFMNLRQNLVSFEEEGDWRRWGEETFDDWEAFKDTYIDRMVWEEQQIAAERQSDPSVFGGLFTGPDKRTYLPGRANRVYVQREGRSASFHGAPLTQKQEWDIMLQGKHPEGYEIIYVDENGTILSEAPPPIPPPTGEERRQMEAWLKRGESQQTSDMPDQTSEDWDDWDSGGQDRPSGDETMSAKAQDVQKQFERAQAEALERATKGDTEIGAELEKQLTPELLTTEGVETELSGRFSPERLEKAREVLGRYGPEEGMRRLREDDPEVAAQVERQRRNRNPAESETEEPENPTR